MYIKHSKYYKEMHFQQRHKVADLRGSLSSIVITDVLGEPISTTSGLSTEVIIKEKYSDSSAVLSSIGDTVKMAYG